MAVLGSECGLVHEVVAADLEGVAPAAVLVGVYTQEGTHIEPTTGQIWPRYA